jgi:hypothetical protein
LTLVALFMRALCVFRLFRSRRVACAADRIAFHLGINRFAATEQRRASRQMGSRTNSSLAAGIPDRITPTRAASGCCFAARPCGRPPPLFQAVRVLKKPTGKDSPLSWRDLLRVFRRAEAEVARRSPLTHLVWRT